MKKKIWILISIIMVISLTACSTATTEPAATEEPLSSETIAATDVPTTTEPIKIGMSMANNDDFTTQLSEMYREAANNYGGIELTILNAQSDAKKQLTDVESLIAQGMDVIVLRAVDSDASVPAAEAIKAAGIYLVIDATPLNNYDNYDVLLNFDQAEHGKMLGTYIQNWLDEDPTREANMGYIYGMVAEVLMGRETGIYETAPSVNKVIDGIGNWSADDAMALAEDWLIAYPEINIIACANDEMAGGVIQAVNAAGLKGKIMVLGVDGTETGQAYIRSGEMAATTFQDISIQADKMIEVAAGLVKGEKFDKYINLEMLKLMTIDTIDSIVGPAK
ncbi:MAG: substrate-binding domain-containing protein [Anaerolineaceae bacterium]